MYPTHKNKINFDYVIPEFCQGTSLGYEQLQPVASLEHVKKMYYNIYDQTQKSAEKEKRNIIYTDIKS